MLVTAGLVSDAALRDRSVGMDSLLFTTRLKPAEYLGGRFLAVLLINAVLALAIPLGLWLASLMPYLDREGFVSNRAASYVQPVLLFTLPNLVLVGVVLFSVAVLTRHAVGVYLGAIVMFIGYLVAAGLWAGISNSVLSALADPLGINALKAMTKYWPAAERNVRTIGFPMMLVWNRVLWLAIASGVLALVVRRFRFSGRDPRFARLPRSSSEGNRARSTESARVSASATIFDRRTGMVQLLAVVRDALAGIVAGWPFRVAFLGAIVVVPMLGWDVGSTIYDTVTWPATHLVAGVIIAERTILIPWLVLVLFAGELVWKDRDSGVAEIADAVPVRTGTVIAGRFLALVAIIALFQSAFMLGGMSLQALHGYYAFEPLLYVKSLFGLELADFILLAALAMTVHVVVNQKYVAHLLMIVVIVFCQGAMYHPLVVFNRSPRWVYSDMNGFGPFVTAFVAFKLYWGAWAVLLGVVAFLRLVARSAGRTSQPHRRRACAVHRARGTRGSRRSRARPRVGRLRLLQHEHPNEYLPWNRTGAPQAEYERRYGRYRDLPQPVITAADLRFEIYPEKTAVDMRGSYRLVNQTGAPIDAVHIEAPRERGGYVVRSMSFDRAAKPQLVDAAYGYRSFTLEQPLQPGDSLRFTFDTSYRPRGFTSEGAQTKIVRNGTYFDRLLLPFVGYQPFELRDAKERVKYGLPPHRGIADPSDADASRSWNALRAGDAVQVETVVGTSPDQIAVVPGVLRRSWTENGRCYFHYGSRRPETFTTAVFSAKYAVRSAQANGVTLEVLHHPPHRANLDRMTAGMKSALEYYTAQFGPYPYRELRIVELPPYSVNGRAFPAALALGEQNFITRTGPGTVDLTYFGTAHETAHQWWGGQVRPAYAKGRTFVSESLANYSAMTVTEKFLGSAEARRVYDYQMERYLTQRAEYGRDVPLLRAEDQTWVSYGKGAVALYTLRERIGAEAVNGALRRFLEKYCRGGAPYATSLDLYAELRAATPPSLHPLLTDLFETITLWDLKTESATSRRLPNGQYEVTLNVRARKLRADEVGRETQTPMDDLVEVGVFSGDKTEPFYVTQQHVRSGDQTLKIIVPQPPSRAGVDPIGKLIERNRLDNVVAVTQ